MLPVDVVDALQNAAEHCLLLLFDVLFINWCSEELEKDNTIQAHVRVCHLKINLTLLRIAP